MSRLHLTLLSLLIILTAGVACQRQSIFAPAAQRSAEQGQASDGMLSAQATLLPTPTQWPTPVGEAWRTIAPGVEQQSIDVHGPHLRFPVTMQLIRLNPSLVKMHTHYSPVVPLKVADWQRETRAMIIINGGFFTRANRTDGLIVTFGQPFGKSFAEGGMFFLQQGEVGIRDLMQAPYLRGESLDEAVQAFPMLVFQGRAVHPGDDGRFNRRTAIAVDRQGRVILLAVDEPTVSLFELSRWLAASGLDLEAAVNLDGGSSTGMVVATGSDSFVMDSRGPVPMVLAVYP